MRELCVSELTSVSAGHGGVPEYTFFATLFFALGLPHTLIGLREFHNYVGDLMEKGVEEGDHFTIYWRDFFKVKEKVSECHRCHSRKV